jgi:hypothetical protein
MPQLSLKKILTAIVVIIILVHLGEILDNIEAIRHWFVDRLRFVDDFPDGAQAAIAFCSILLIVVIVFKTINRRF